MQTFREVREQNCYYVDKTAYIERLLDRGKHYFLSRPRRFGKSLLLDTIKELFEGNEPLFEGLHVHDGWNWSERHPVVRLDFGGGSFGQPGLLEANVMEQLAAAERRLGVTSEYLTAPGRFAYLLEALHRHTGRTVVGAGRRVRQTDPGHTEHSGNSTRQPRLPERPVRHDQVQRRSRPVHVGDGSEQVQQGEHFLGLEQSHRHHPGPPLPGDLRIY